jgi:hypothetical protein
MPLSAKQKEIADCTKRWRICVAGRRTGKTHLAMRELARFASIPNSVVWYLTGSRMQAKTLVWSKLKKKLKSLNWIESTNESELLITLKNNSQICLKSAEQGDNLRGESLNFLVIDEFCDIDLDEIFFQILRPALSDKRGACLMLGTPKAGNQTARDLFDRHLVNSNWASFTYSTLAGGFVDAEEVEQARQDLSPKVFQQEYEATFVSFAGVIFSDFGEHNISEVRKPSEHEPIYIGMDFNITPMSAVIGRQTKMGIEIYDEIYLDNSNTSEIIAEIRNRYPTNPVTVFPDSSAVARKTSAGGNTDIKLLETAGFVTRYPRQHALVRDRINCGNSLFFKRTDGTTRFTIDPACKKTIACLKNWAYKPDSMIPDKNGSLDWSHGCDALTYMIQFLFPINKPVAPIAPQRFGHRVG